MVTWHGAHYALPVGLIEKYKLEDESKIHLSIGDVLGGLINEHGEAHLTNGVLTLAVARTAMSNFAQYRSSKGKFCMWFLRRSASVRTLGRAVGSFVPS